MVGKLFVRSFLVVACGILAWQARAQDIDTRAEESTVRRDRPTMETPALTPPARCTSSTPRAKPSPNEAAYFLLMIRQARLEAELHERDAILFPESLQPIKDDDAFARAIRDEGYAFSSKKLTYSSQIDTLNRASSVLRQEIEIDTAKYTLAERQVELLRQQLNNIISLYSKGGVVVTQRNNLEQSLTQYQSFTMDLKLAILKAQNDLATYERSVKDLREQRRYATLTELAQVQDKLADAAVQTPPLRSSDAGAVGSAGQPCLSRRKLGFDMRGTDGTMLTLYTETENTAATAP